MISLYGSMARIFERRYRTSAKNIPIQVNSVGEAMKAMEANFNGFKQLIRKKGLYHLVRGKDLQKGRTVAVDELDMTFGEKDWHVIPVAAGCKDGVAGVVWGAVLFVAGAVTNYFLPGNPVSAYMMKAGVVLMVGGAAQMLAPSPHGLTDREKPDEKASYLFNGPVNAVEPGTTIPVGYGEFFVGTITVSGGLKVEKI